MLCALCRAYLVDHYDILFRISFPKRAHRLHPTPFLEFIKEVSHTMKSCHAHPKEYEVLVINFNVKEMKQGTAAAEDYMFMSQPLLQSLYENTECILFDAGLGKQIEIRNWLRTELFRTFQTLLGIHAEHTGKATPLSLGAPIPYRRPAGNPVPKKKEFEFVDYNLYG